MTVNKPTFLAEIRIDYHILEKWESMQNYMVRHGWKFYTNNFYTALDNATIHCNFYRKEFESVDVMQREIQDINDAFNR